MIDVIDRLKKSDSRIKECGHVMAWWATSCASLLIREKLAQIWLENDKEKDSLVQSLKDDYLDVYNFLKELEFKLPIDQLPNKELFNETVNRYEDNTKKLEDLVCEAYDTIKK